MNSSGNGVGLGAAAGAEEEAGDAGLPQVAGIVAGVRIGQDGAETLWFAAGDSSVVAEDGLEDVFVVGEVERLHDDAEDLVLRIGGHFDFVAEVGVVGSDLRPRPLRCPP